jgi:hypothetical protein
MTVERPMFPPRAESVDSFLPQPFISSGQKNGKWSLPCWGLLPAV